jgi:hypothetical protein
MSASLMVTLFSDCHFRPHAIGNEPTCPCDHLLLQLSHSRLLAWGIDYAMCYNRLSGSGLHWQNHGKDLSAASLLVRASVPVMIPVTI